MGGAVSSGESNDDLVDNLLESSYIKDPELERVFRAVDRALYYTVANKKNAYKDLAWKDGNLHMSAPCIYSEVMENLSLSSGMSFLNMGSGTGYLSTMCGLIIGKNGVNHGIEMHSDVTEYAREKLDEFLRTSPAIDLFDFCCPDFIVGNCLDPISTLHRYDRIYCGAACPEESIRNITDLLKVGGICVIPINDCLTQITRISEDKDERKALLPVSFATLISPRNGIDKKPVILPEWKPPSLRDLCRSEIRSIFRSTIINSEVRAPGEERRKKRRKKRKERRRASRLLVVQRRRSGAEDGETGFVAVAYSLGNNTSDEEENEINERERNIERIQEISSTESDSDEDDRNFLRFDQFEDEPMQQMDYLPLPINQNNETLTESQATSSSSNANHVASGSSVTGTGSKNKTHCSLPSYQTKNASDGLSPSSSSGTFKSTTRHVLVNRSTRCSRQSASSSPLGLFGRLREQYRRREQGRNNVLRQFEQNLQQISSRAVQVGRQLVSTASQQFNMDLEDGERVSPSGPMDENADLTENNDTPAGISDNIGKRNDRNDDSCASTDTSLDTSSSSNSSEVSSEDDEESHKRKPCSVGSRGERNRTSATSNESGIGIDMDSLNKEDKVDKEFGDEEEECPFAKLKNNLYSTKMKNKIDDLPLIPPSMKNYLNFYRQF